jgi:hypothetical protein
MSIAARPLALATASCRSSAETNVSLTIASLAGR